MSTTESALLAAYPPELSVGAADVAEVARRSPGGRHRVFVVLDDDPTGTQSVANLPVLTRWDVEDFSWAFQQGAPAVYVLTNTRSLDPAEAAARNEDVVRNALVAASDLPGAEPVRVSFVSRSDSTLRGHFPLETDVIASTLREVADQEIDGVVMVPAFPDAGRVTIGGTHYVRGPGDDQLTPAAETEFAADASFGYEHSYLPDYVEEKSGGRIAASSVIVLDLGVIRSGSPEASSSAIADAVGRARGGTPIVADIVTENDLRALSLGLDEAERRGASLLYRVGPPFMRARIGQEMPEVLTGAESYARTGPSAAGGLVVVGSHVAVTTRQLAALTAEHPRAAVVELDVAHLLDDRTEVYLDGVVDDVVRGLAERDVILHTSRSLVRTQDPAESLRIARTVSAAVVDVVRRTLALAPPRFVIAKGGITSSDVAAHGLQIRQAMVRGPMLPGIVSLWEPVGGPAQGIPFVVFAGNVGDDRALVDVVRKLSSTWHSPATPNAPEGGMHA